MTLYEAQWLTVAFILFLVAATVSYDIAIIHWFGSEASISRVCGYAMRKYPVIAAWMLIGVGIYVGHTWLSAW
jgi:hypothetical protein